MKKVSVLVLLAVVLIVSLGSCKKLIDKVFNGFDAEVPEVVVNIPYYPVPPGYPVPSDEIPFSYTQKFNLDSLIKAKTGGTFGAGDVSSVKLKQMTLTITNPDANNNLANFKSARFGITSNTNSNEATIATFTFPDTYKDTDTYIASSNSAELVAYLKGADLTYKMSTMLRRYTTKPVTLSMKAVLTMK